MKKYTKEEIKEILDMIEKHGLIVVPQLAKKLNRTEAAIRTKYYATRRIN